MQEKVARSRFTCLTRTSGTAASTGLHTARAACSHLKTRHLIFLTFAAWTYSWLPTMVTFLPLHPIPHAPLQGWKSHWLYQVSEPHAAALWFPPHRCPTQGLRCACEIVQGHRYTILHLIYKLLLSGISNTLWPGSLSVPMLPVEVTGP